MAARYFFEAQHQLADLIEAPASALCVIFLILLGLNAIRSRAVALVRFVYIYFVRGGKNLRVLGEWAVVTGATDGIGKAYAEALAKKGESRVCVL